MIKIIAAVSDNNVIGNANDLPWNIPYDLKRFKLLTEGFPVIMGYNTFISIQTPLVNRTNIIVSTELVSAIGFEWFSTIEEAILNYSNAWIIGGAQIYKYVLDNKLADEMFITLIHEEFEGDTYFPEFDSNWVISKEIDIPSNDITGGHNLTIIKYIRNEQR